MLSEAARVTRPGGTICILTGISQPETRNPKLSTRNPKPETRNPKPETRNPKPETLIPDPRTQNYSAREPSVRSAPSARGVDPRRPLRRRPARLGAPRPHPGRSCPLPGRQSFRIRSPESVILADCSTALHISPHGCSWSG